MHLVHRVVFLILLNIHVFSFIAAIKKAILF